MLTQSFDAQQIAKTAMTVGVFNDLTKEKIQPPNDGQLTADECAALYEYAAQAPVGIWVELGCYKGRSTVVLAAAARKHQANLLTIDNFLYGRFGKSSPSRVLDTLNRAGIPNGSFVLRGESDQPPAWVREESVGLLFVDTDHRPEPFLKEMKAWRPLLKEGALVICHDYQNDLWPDLTQAIDSYFQGCAQRVGLTEMLIVFKV